MRMISADSLLTMVLVFVPQHRHRHPSGVVGLGRQIQLVEITRLVQGIGHHPGTGLEAPAVIAHVPVHHRDIDHPLQSLQSTENQSAMGPRTGIGNVKMIASGFGLEAIPAARPRGAVGGDPVAESRRLTLEAPAAFLGIVPLVVPLPVDQQTHADPLMICVCSRIVRTPDHGAWPAFLPAAQRPVL